MAANRRQLSRVALALVLASWPQFGRGATVTLKSGARYEGNVARLSGVAENPLSPSSNVERKPVVVCDDGVRFTYVPYHQAEGFVETPPKNHERIKIPQLVASGGRRIVAVGDPLSISPFDQFGRRYYQMRVDGGRTLDVFQGITEITPTYTKIEGIRCESPCVWDLRIATSSIPAATLRKVLLRAEGADAKNADARLRVVRLFIQAEMYREALAELDLILKDFPDLAHLKDQQVRLVQLLAQQVLRDIELRRDAGQHQRVIALLENFPDRDVAAETLLRVRDMLKDYDDQRRQSEQVVAHLDKHLASLADPDLKTRLAPVKDEIQRELNIHNLNRMADYLRLADDDTMATDQKLSLAISGWFLGSGSGIENLAVASSLMEVRELALKYLRSELVHEREELISRIKGLEGGTPAYVAKLVAHLKPPVETQVEPAGAPGLYELKVKGIEDQAEFTYLVQLPPEYDPWKRYPCVVTLNGGGSTELQQISWWAGDYVEKSGMRTGQAARRGYVVIAPRWQRPLQSQYEYSLREHAAVLFALRDAMQRISIDSDQVFLSGHFAGGDAAWDIALAHPDLWAGCVMFAPHADRYVKYYRDNARTVPLYFVTGEKDVGTGEQGNWLVENGTEMDRYLSDTRTDCTLVVYRGRGRDLDGFADEVQRIFDWMSLSSHRRNAAPQSFEVVSMRPWDNYFWWVECEGFPASSTVLPQAWPQSGARAAQIKAEVIAKSGRVQIKSAASQVTVYLSPEIVDFSRPIQVAVDGQELRTEPQPDVAVILEDARSRADRQHPFWTQLQWPERRDR
ncbi:MAG: peptidase [Pirellulaceae bacterium]